MNFFVPTNRFRFLVRIALIILCLLIKGVVFSEFAPRLEQTAPVLTWHGWFTIAVLAAALYVMIKEIRPPDVTMLISAAVLTVAGALTPRQFLEGFSSDIVMTLALLCIIVRTLEANGILNILTNHILPDIEQGGKTFLSLLFPVSLMSAFLNNTVIVLMMTPIVRKWALKNQLSPSKYLIPVSYASIVGGLCTLIGTSTNVIVDGLLRSHNPNEGLGFFELAIVGLPCVAAVLLFLAFIGRHLLPHRLDVTTAMSEQTKEFTGEFLIEADCPFANKLIKEAAGKFFPGELLIEIERVGRTITAPGPFDVILPGDRLVFAGDIQQIAELHTIKGLLSAADPHFKLDETSSHFSEAVVALTSSLIGRTPQEVNFRKRFGASVLAVYRQGQRLSEKVGEIVLDAGDTLALLSTEPWPGERYSRDFYYIRYSEKLAIPQTGRSLWIGAVLGGMVLMAVLGVHIMICALIAVIAFIFTRTITIREAQKGIFWNVLLLIASSMAVANAVESTGVASYFAHILLSFVGSHPYALISGILLATTIFTEMLSNNAAALLLFPVALEAVRLAGYTSPEALKAVGVTVAIGASCGFALPTGYQTHMIVYGPGGYRFKDFMIVGILTDLIIFFLALLIIPALWPLA